MPIAFITGASSGIGQALARVLADRGYDVALFARSTAPLDALAEEIRRRGRKAVPISGDVTQLDDLTAARTLIAQQLGAVDLLVANAGIGRVMSVDRIKIKHTVNIMKVNVIGAIQTIETFLPDLLERGSGRIAGIASLAGFRGLPQNAAYCASKSALITYLESLRTELRPRGISVTTVCPGYVETPLTAQNGWMPFLWPAEKAAIGIARAIERRHRVYRFPLPMSLLLHLTQWMPDPLFDFIMKPRPGKKARTSDANQKNQTKSRGV